MLTPDNASTAEMELLAKARTHHQSGQLPDAFQAYQQILTSNPSNVEALHECGILLARSGELDKAIDLISRAVEINPENASCHGSLSTLFRAKDQLLKAIEFSEEAIRLEPESARWHCELGQALSLQGLNARAVHEFKNTLEIDASIAEAHHGLGNSLFALERTEEAIEAFQSAVKLSPNDPNIWYNYHAVLYNDANPGPATEALKNAIRLNPNHKKAIFFLWTLLDDQGDSAGASECLKQLGVGPDASNPYLDSWQYIQKARTASTRLFSSTAATLRYCLSQISIDGLVLEFGVRTGTSTRLIAETTGKEVHGFDSFEGIPESWGAQSSGAYTTGGELPEVPANVELHVGWFSDTLPGFIADHNGSVSFINVDCDLYSSTKSIFDHLGERIVPGTVIVFDEYLLNREWKEDEYKAFQEAAQHYGWTYEYLAFSLFSKQAGVRILEVAH